MNLALRWMFLVMATIGTVSCIRTKDKMFMSISGASCFRRLNATHTTGCSSKFGGSTGVLHLIKTNEDFHFITNNPPAPPYALVILPHLFTRDNIMRIKNDKHVSAIVVINATKEMTQFSNELNCPNSRYGVANNQTCEKGLRENSWNPFGTGLLHEDFPFPISFIADEMEIKKIVDCWEKFNSFDLSGQSKRSLCSIEINAFMSAALNSRVCLRRTTLTNSLSVMRYCDPLSGQNVYATLYPRESIPSTAARKVQSEERFIMISTRIDTTSMFDGMGPGAMDSLVSYATLIGTAHMLSVLLPERIHSNHSNVLFVLFNGESYDYIGSQRFVYDMKKGEFPPISQHTHPISLDNIDVMIDLGTLDDAENITIYHATDFPQVEKLRKLLQNHNLNVNQTLTRNLPPVSAQSILRENITFPALILQSNPTNRFYHSIYDDAKNINFTYYNTSSDFTQLDDHADEKPFPLDSIQIKIRNISTALTKSIYQMVTGDSIVRNGQFASSALVDELLYCFLISSECRLLAAASPPNSLPNLPIPLLRYVSVSGSYTHQSTGWTYRILGLLLGQKVDRQKEDCSNLPFYWFAGYNGSGECHQTTQNLSNALSPAFLEDDYDWNSGKYSTWTESTWKELNARIFLKPSPSHEAFTLAVGFAVMLISFVLIFLINSRSDVLFGDAVSTAEISSRPAHC